MITTTASMLTIIASFILLHLSTVALVNAKTTRPHILIIILDDVGRADTEVYGKIDIPTPKLKDLANNGIVLENYYTQTVCSPTRSALMTGLYPFRFGMQHRTTQLPGTKSHIPLSLPTLPELLEPLGYRRHAVGKWHCGYAHWKYTPTGRGFESHFGYFQAEIDYYNKTFFHDQYGEGADFWRNKQYLPDSIGKFSLDQYQSEFISVVKNYTKTHNTEELQSQEPLFLYYAMQSVHIPLQSRKDEDRCKEIKNYSRRVYCNMVVEMDDSIGSAIQTFKDNKLWDNTIVFLTTDNGGMVNYASDSTGYPQFPASAGSNYPLRGSKTTLFEGGVRSLALISGGKNFFVTENKGKQYKGLMHVVDLSASIIRLTGVKYNRIDGIDQWDDILQIKTDAPKRLHVPINLVNKCITYTSIRFENYKLLIDQDPQSKADGYFFANGSKPIRVTDNKQSPFLLFDLEKDPNEHVNLVETKDQLIKNADTVLHGLKELLKYIITGYHEPQSFLLDFDPRSLPQLHHKFWAPFLTQTQNIDILDPTDALAAGAAVVSLIKKWFGNQFVIDTKEIEASIGKVAIV